MIDPNLKYINYLVEQAETIIANSDTNVYRRVTKENQKEIQRKLIERIPIKSSNIDYLLKKIIETKFLNLIDKLEYLKNLHKKLIIKYVEWAIRIALCLETSSQFLNEGLKLQELNKGLENSNIFKMFSEEYESVRKLTQHIGNILNLDHFQIMLLFTGDDCFNDMLKSLYSNISLLDIYINNYTYMLRILSITMPISEDLRSNLNQITDSLNKESAIELKICDLYNNEQNFTIKACDESSYVIYLANELTRMQNLCSLDKFKTSKEKNMGILRKIISKFLISKDVDRRNYDIIFQRFLYNISNIGTSRENFQLKDTLLKVRKKDDKFALSNIYDSITKPNTSFEKSDNYCYNSAEEALYVDMDSFNTDYEYVEMCDCSITDPVYQNIKSPVCQSIKDPVYQNIKSPVCQSIKSSSISKHSLYYGLC